MRNVCLRLQLLVAAYGVVAVGGCASRRDPPVASTAAPAQEEEIGELSTGTSHACFARRGEVYCWGDNRHGQLGDGTKVRRAAVEKVRGISDVVEVSAGSQSSCARRADGEVYCWGGEYGTTPQPVPALRGAVSVSTAGAHVCVALADGRVRCVGSNSDRHLGAGAESGGVVDVATVDQVVQVATGNWHTCARTRDGRVRCWGSAMKGLDGDILTDATTLSAGAGHACAVRKSGRVSCWGTATSGLKLGAPVPDIAPTGFKPGSPVPDIPATGPVEVIGVTGAVSVSAGGSASCALDSENRIACWGENLQGVLGQPVETTGSLAVELKSDEAFSQVAVGGTFACAVTTKSDVRCWGGPKPALGTFAHRWPVAKAPACDRAQQVDVGRGYTCARCEAGAVVCMGQNRDGRVGPVPSERVSSPTQVEGLGPASDISAGTHTCAISEGRVYCWGAPSSGALGNGVAAIMGKQPWPVRAAGVERATQVTAGDGFSCAQNESGEVWCWGTSRSGELALAERSYSAVPRRIDGVTNSVEVRGGLAMACSRTSTGQVLCWGDFCGWSNQQPLGDVAPARVEGISEAKALAVGSGFACALTPAGEVLCWGCRYPRGERSRMLRAARVEGVTGAEALTAGDTFTCVRRVDGEVSCWHRDGLRPTPKYSAPQVVPGLRGASSLDVDIGRICGVVNGTLKCASVNSDSKTGVPSFDAAVEVPMP